MDLTQIATIFSICAFIWQLRKDSKEDYVRMDAKMERWRQEQNVIMNAIQAEIKEFHSRMCELESKKK